MIASFSLDAFLECLRIAGVADEKQRWIGRDAVVVQMGDIFDRGVNDLEIEILIAKFRDEAEAAGGAVYTIMGNHEVMNAMGNHQMAPREAFEPFQALEEELAEDMARYSNYLERRKVPEWARPRLVAMLPGGPVARLMAARSLALVLGDTLFVHAGLLPAHLEPENCGGFAGRDCLRQLNKWASGFLLGEEPGAGPREEVWNPDGPLWTRALSMPDSEQLDPLRLADLAAVFAAVGGGVTRMVVGHTPQQMGVNAVGFIAAEADDAASSAASAPKKQLVWRVDTGMTATIYGNVEVLEILADGTTTILNGTARIPSAERELLTTGVQANAARKIAAAAARKISTIAAAASATVEATAGASEAVQVAVEAASLAEEDGTEAALLAEAAAEAAMAETALAEVLDAAEAAVAEMEASAAAQAAVAAELEAAAAAAAASSADAAAAPSLVKVAAGFAA
ncbi:unnamed protein product [Phaeothamnion confervicola]